MCGIESAGLGRGDGFDTERPDLVGGAGDGPGDRLRSPEG